MALIFSQQHGTFKLISCRIKAAISSTNSGFYLSTRAAYNGNKIFFINLISVCEKYEKIHDEYNRKLFRNLGSGL